MLHRGSLSTHWCIFPSVIISQLSALRSMVIDRCGEMNCILHWGSIFHRSGPRAKCAETLVSLVGRYADPLALLPGDMVAVKRMLRRHRLLLCSAHGLRSLVFAMSRGFCRDSMLLQLENSKWSRHQQHWQRLTKSAHARQLSYARQLLLQLTLRSTCAHSALLPTPHRP